MSPARSEKTELVDPPNFLSAIRDAGYRSPASALAELIDNSVEAGACLIEVIVSVGGDGPSSIEVRDNGVGMTRAILDRALRFGGSSRFGSRTSLGRFGMGLPTASLSISRRVEVETWRGSSIHRAVLAIDGEGQGLSPTRSRRRRSSDDRPASGTRVRLTDCDRLGYRTRGWLVRHLRTTLAATYRSVLSDSVKILIDGEELPSDDHLMLDRGARRFGDDLVFEVPGSTGDRIVMVRFSELPVNRWAGLSDAEKRSLGVLRNEPVSVMRADREIDRGWFFMGNKPRENYDSWWRCEVSFGPSLDEHFGVTFTKQRIRPTPELSALLASDLEPVARALNSRARAAFDTLRLEEPRLQFEQNVKSTLSSLTRGRWQETISVEFRQLSNGRCVEVVSTNGGCQIMVNTGHAAFRHMYRPLAEVDSSESRRVAQMALGAVVAPQLANLLADYGMPGDWDDVFTTLLGLSQ